MNHGDFKNLLTQQGWQDRWWISIDGELSPQVVTLDSAFASKAQNPNAAVLLINEAENRDTSLWHMVEIDPPPVATPPPAAAAPAAPALAPAPQLGGAAPPLQQNHSPSAYSIQTVAAAHQQIAYGILLLLVSWGVKQVLTSFAIFGLGGALTQPALMAKVGAKSASEVAELQTELDELRSSGSSDRGRMSKLQSEISETRGKIQEEYEDDLNKASVKTAKGSSTALGATRNFFRWKLVLDFLKIGALVMMALGALKLIRDEEASLPNRALGISLTIVIVFTVLVSGLVSMVS